MADQELLAEEFDRHAARLRSVAYRVLGSRAEAEDAVQETWIRLSRTDGDAVDNLGGWLTTVVSRVSIDMLRSRGTRREAALTDTDRGIDAGAEPAGGPDPEAESVLADAVGAALLVVLETLAPGERLAFVLHDTFQVPFAEIGAILGRSPAATKQLAHRARLKVRGADADSDVVDVRRQRAVVEAFLQASREGDLEGLITVLDPGVVMEADARAVAMGSAALVSDAANVAAVFSGRALAAQPAIVDGAVAIVWARDGRVVVVWDTAVVDGRIDHIDMLADPETIERLDITLL